MTLEMKQLTDIVSVRTTRVNPQDFSETQYISMADVESDTGRIINETYGKQMRSTSARFEKGDVLYGRLRPYLNKVVCAEFDGLSSTEFIILISSKDVLPQYLAWRLRATDFVNFANSLNAGDRPRVKYEQIAPFRLYCPSVSVQQRIINQVETQFTRLDAAIKSLKAIKAKIKLFRISVLKATFDREWHYDKLGHLFKTTSGGTPSRSNKKYYTGTIPWLKSGELNDDKHIEDSEEHITQEAIDNSSAKKFPPNTVMIALYGATTGKLGILKKESTTNQAICGIFPQEGYITEFVFYFLLFKRAALISQGKGGAQPNISQGIVKDTDFPKADEKTQREVINFVESQLSIIDKISDVVDASLVKTEKLRKSILKSAFEGKFTPLENFSNGACLR